MRSASRSLWKWVRQSTSITVWSISRSSAKGCFTWNSPLGIIKQDPKCEQLCSYLGSSHYKTPSVNSVHTWGLCIYESILYSIIKRICPLEDKYACFPITINTTKLTFLRFPHTLPYEPIFYGPAHNLCGYFSICPQLVWHFAICPQLVWLFYDILGHKNMQKKQRSLTTPLPSPKIFICPL
jgi:hypothetical protein